MGLASTRDSGIMLTLDEAHLAARAELASLAALLQEGTGERWPLVVIRWIAVDAISGAFGDLLGAWRLA